MKEIKLNIGLYIKAEHLQDISVYNENYYKIESYGEPKVADWLSVSWVDSYDVIAWKEIVLPRISV